MANTDRQAEGWGDETPQPVLNMEPEGGLARIVPPVADRAAVGPVPTQLHPPTPPPSDEPGEQEDQPAPVPDAVDGDLPDDFAGALRLVKLCEALPADTAGNEARKARCLHRAQQNLHRVQQGPKPPAITADHMASHVAKQGVSLREERWDYFARQHGPAREMLDEITKLRESNVSTSDMRAAVDEVERLQGIAAGRAMEIQQLRGALDLARAEIEKLKKKNQK